MKKIIIIIISFLHLAPVCIAQNLPSKMFYRRLKKTIQHFRPCEKNWMQKKLETKQAFTFRILNLNLITFGEILLPLETERILAFPKPLIFHRRTNTKTRFRKIKTSKLNWNTRSRKKNCFCIPGLFAINWFFKMR